MSKNKRMRRATAPCRPVSSQPATGNAAELIRPKKPNVFGYLRKRLWLVGIVALLSFGALGAGLKYLDEDARREMLKNSKDRSFLSSVNPFVPMPTPTPTPQISKEYVYAGSRLVAVEDTAASAIPPGDLAVWRPSNGYWYVKGAAGSTETYYQWGQAGDQTAQGDYDGDGKTDFSIYRGATTGYWWVTRSSDGSYYSLPQGATGDKPVPGDYDGDGKTDHALFRASNNTWYIIRSSDSTTYSVAYGSSGDVTAQADYDGDGKTDLATWRPSNKTFYPTLSANLTTPSFQVGASSSDIPVSADYDGDGLADCAVMSGTDGKWTIRSSQSGSTTVTDWTLSSDIPVQNDYDGDGKVDIATWRPSGKGVGRWLIRNSSDGSQRMESWGVAGDIPVPALYRR